MDNLYSKLIKVASYLDKNGYHKECDEIEKHLTKIAALALPGELAQLPKAGKGILDIIKSIPKFKLPTAPRLPKLPSNNFRTAPPALRPGRTPLPMRVRPEIIFDTPPLETPPLEVAPPNRDPFEIPLPPIISPETPVLPSPITPDLPGTVTPDLPDLAPRPIIEPEPDLIPDNPVIPTPRPRPRPTPLPLPPPFDDVRPLPPGRQNPNPTPLPPGRPEPTPLPPGRPNPNPQPPGKPNPPGQKPPNKPPTDNPKKPPIIPFVPILFGGKKEDAGELYYEGDTSSKDT